MVDRVHSFNSDPLYDWGEGNKNPQENLTEKTIGKVWERNMVFYSYVFDKNGDGNIPKLSLCQNPSTGFSHAVRTVASMYDCFHNDEADGMAYLKNTFKHPLSFSVFSDAQSSRVLPLPNDTKYYYNMDAIIDTGIKNKGKGSGYGSGYGQGSNGQGSGSGNYCSNANGNANGNSNGNDDNSIMNNQYDYTSRNVILTNILTDYQDLDHSLEEENFILSDKHGRTELSFNSPIFIRKMTGMILLLSVRRCLMASTNFLIGFNRQQANINFISLVNGIHTDHRLRKLLYFLRGTRSKLLCLYMMCSYDKPRGRFYLNGCFYFETHVLKQHLIENFGEHGEELLVGFCSCKLHTTFLERQVHAAFCM